MTDRDYAAEMRAIIDTDANPADGPYDSRVAASKIVAKLRETDPEFLAAWLDAQAEHFVWQAINDRDRSRRSHERATGGRSVFGKAVEDFAGGDLGALTGWLDKVARTREHWARTQREATGTGGDGCR